MTRRDESDGQTLGERMLDRAIDLLLAEGRQLWQIHWAIDHVAHLGGSREPGWYDQAGRRLDQPGS